MNSRRVNKQLQKWQQGGHTGFLSRLIYFMYKRKGIDIKSVNYLPELNVWEFEIGKYFFYSSGPGWAYDYKYLFDQLVANLGFMYMPKEGDLVIDVGAGVGEELMVFSKSVGQAGKVFAIEAHPKTFSALKFNNDKNGFTNTTLLNVAVADLAGDIFIEDSSDSLENKVNKEQSAKGFKVEAITIAQLIDRFNIDSVDFMKVNIEGAEQLLIKGIGDSLHKIKNLAISCHDFRFQNEGNEFFKTKSLVHEFLKDNNFECTIRNTGNPLLDDYIYAHPKK